MSNQPPERVVWFLLKAQTDLMERYMMSSPFVHMRGWRYYVDREEDVLRGVVPHSTQRIVPLSKQRVRWYQHLMECEHKDG